MMFVKMKAVIYCHVEKDTLNCVSFFETYRRCMFGNFLKFSHDDNDHGDKEKMATRIRDLELNKEVEDSELKK